MILTVIDPALLTYDCEDLNTGRSCCFERLEALTNHRGIIKKYNVRIAASQSLINLILCLFPWKQSGNNMLRDLREFMLSDLQRKADYVDTDESTEVEISPKRILCQYVKRQDLVRAWGQVLARCVSDGNAAQHALNIATWDCRAIVPQIEFVIVARVAHQTSKASHKYCIPLVWNCDSWANQLINQDWWPDLHLMVRLTFATNTAIKNHAQARLSPMIFDCSDEFWESAHDVCCDNHTRQSFVKALTKLIYGVHDKGLGLEPVQSRSGVYRFRVTRTVRVHYHTEGERLIIDKIGPHRINDVG